MDQSLIVIDATTIGMRDLRTSEGENAGPYLPAAATNPIESDLPLTSFVAIDHAEPTEPFKDRVELSVAERDAAKLMALDGACESPEAYALIDALVVQLFSGKRGHPTKAYRQAMGAIASDLLQHGRKDPLAWSYRTLRPKDFTGQRVGYRLVRSIIDAMTAANLIDIVPGHQQWTTWGDVKAKSWSMATRLRGTLAFFAMVTAQGIEAAEWENHFSIVAQPPIADVPNPLERREGHIMFGAAKGKVVRMPVDLTDPIARELHDRVVRLNTFMMDHAIGGLGHRGFRRIFSDGDSPDFAWNKGGRLYSIDTSSYQNAPSEKRAGMTINGEAVVEIDIAASHLTILHALHGLPFDPSTAYKVDGLPRGVVKRWVTMTLGHDRLHIRWPKGVQAKVEEELPEGLKGTLSLADIRDMILPSIPLLREWKQSPYRWTDLQFVESVALVDTVETLAFEHGVPGLPVHDSIIIPASKEALGRKALALAFKKAVGVLPELKVA